MKENSKIIALPLPSFRISVEIEDPYKHLMLLTPDQAIDLAKQLYASVEVLRSDLVALLAEE